jgi:uncharacterized NAD(P)/FAD-binding protein YdhS
MTQKIAIIGAGFSGAITAINLLRKSKISIEVTLIDTLRVDAKGLAYSTFDDNCVLNVPAQNMSAFPDKPDDFVDFCNAKDSALVATSFVPRRIYGEYLKHLLTIAIDEYPGKLILLKERVIALNKLTTGYRLLCENDFVIDAHVAILAFGHFAPKSLEEIFVGKIDSNTLLVNNPWDIAAVDNLPRNQDILIIGTGHTAIDTLFRLETTAIDRRIFMFSRHGLHPRGHRPFGEFQKDLTLQSLIQGKVLDVVSCSHSVTKLMKTVRTLIGTLGVDWRDVINALRPITSQIWQNLPLAEKARFLRHLVPYWDIFRHRLSPIAFTRLSCSLAESRVQVGAYSIQKVESQNNGLIRVSARCRYQNVLEYFEVGGIINCSGPTYDISNTKNDLVSYLYENKILYQDEVKIGFQVNSDYSVNHKFPGLYYIGPMLKATYWEAIAVPELRVHSDKLANSILNELSEA